MLAALVLLAPLWSTSAGERPEDVEVSANGEWIAVATRSEVLTFQNGREGAASRSPYLPTFLSDTLTLSADGKRFAVISGASVEVRTSRDGRAVSTIKGGKLGGLQYYLARFSPDGRSVAAIRGMLYHNWVEWFDTDSGKRKGTLVEDADGRARDLQFSPDGRYLAVDVTSGISDSKRGPDRSRLIVIDLRTGKAVARYHAEPRAFRFLPDGRIWVLEQGQASFLSLRPIRLTERPVLPVTGPIAQPGNRTQVRWTPNADRLAFIGYDTVFLCGLPEGETRVGENGGEIAEYAIASHAPRIVIGRASGRIEVWPMPRPVG